MLRNGLRQIGPRPAAAAACRREPGSAAPEFSVYRASGPVRYAPAVERGVQRGGVRHLVLDHVLVEVAAPGTPGRWTSRPAAPRSA